MRNGKTCGREGEEQEKEEDREEERGERGWGEGGGGRGKVHMQSLTHIILCLQCRYSTALYLLQGLPLV